MDLVWSNIPSAVFVCVCVCTRVFVHVIECACAAAHLSFFKQVGSMPEKGNGKKNDSHADYNL